MAFPRSGSLFYRDDYDALYEVVWETVQLGGNDVLDFTTIIKQPSVWGEEPQGFIRDRVVFRRGICTTIRQVFESTPSGYNVIAEGMSQIVCVFPTTFNGDDVPQDNFQYHLDSSISDFQENEVTCGPRFSDPDEVDANPIVFSEVTAGGAIQHIAGKQSFQFVDVWTETDEIYSYDCDVT